VTTAERPQRADARRNQAKLIAAAREAFNEHGADASLDDIAHRAGVGPGTLYRHFPTRQVLLAAVYRDDVESLAQRADELAAQLPPSEALTGWLTEQLSYISFKHGLGSAIKAMLAGDSDTMDYCRSAMRGAVARLLDAARADGSVRADIDAATVLRLVHGIGVASESQPDQALPMLSIVLAGLRAPTA
jgi:AcrR family transcriptional regulator